MLVLDLPSKHNKLDTLLLSIQTPVILNQTMHGLIYGCRQVENLWIQFMHPLACAFDKDMLRLFTQIPSTCEYIINTHLTYDACILRVHFLVSMTKLLWILNSQDCINHLMSRMCTCQQMNEGRVHLILMIAPQTNPDPGLLSRLRNTMPKSSSTIAPPLLHPSSAAGCASPKSLLLVACSWRCEDQPVIQSTVSLWLIQTT